MNKEILPPTKISPKRNSENQSITPKASRSNSAKSERDLRFEGSGCESPENSRKGSSSLSPKVSRKYFTNWRTACDKTKDKTRELLKKWRTMPEDDVTVMSTNHSDDIVERKEQNRGWSVHVWSTWVNRFSEELDDHADEDIGPVIEMHQLQSDKLRLFFTDLLDCDADEVISESDFEHFIEKLAHFADWSINSPEYHILLEVKREFIQHFLTPLPEKWTSRSYYARTCDNNVCGVPNRCTIEGWLTRWSIYLYDLNKFTQLPLYLQYLCKILYSVIDKTGNGFISKTALASFYRSVIGLQANRVDEIIDIAYNRLTSNEYLILDYGTYVHCFTNWLIGKNPNGPGQWLLVPPKGKLTNTLYPIDYSALNTEHSKLEPYTPNISTNRHSVIV